MSGFCIGKGHLGRGREGLHRSVHDDNREYIGPGGAATAGYRLPTGDRGLYFSPMGGDSPASTWFQTKRGFFQISHKQYFRPPIHLDGKGITPAVTSKERVRDLYSLIRHAWGNNGIVALSWTVASWFVNPLKEAINFFPFISLYGDPACGKSALTLL